MSAGKTPSLALIVGVGDGLSAAIARKLFKDGGYQLALAARNTDKLAALAKETKASCYSCDASSPQDVKRLYEQIMKSPSTTSSGRSDGSSNSKPLLKVVVYNPGLRYVAPLVDADPNQVKQSLDVTAFGSFLVGQQAAKAMLHQQQQESSGNDNDDSTTSSSTSRGTILFTGATAGIKGFPKSAAFAMGKFAQRGLSESMARELHPQGIHVCWVQIDGIIKHPTTAAARFGAEPTPDAYVDPESIAETYLHIIHQHRSTWTNEVALRSFVEKW